jgi:hypothetical protein
MTGVQEVDDGADRGLANYGSPEEAFGRNVREALVIMGSEMALGGMRVGDDEECRVMEMESVREG